MHFNRQGWAVGMEPRSIIELRRGANPIHCLDNGQTWRHRYRSSPCVADTNVWPCSPLDQTISPFPELRRSRQVFGVSLILYRTQIFPYATTIQFYAEQKKKILTVPLPFDSHSGTYSTHTDARNPIDWRSRPSDRMMSARPRTDAVGNASVLSFGRLRHLASNQDALPKWIARIVDLSG
jgi:hypothetical protein